MSTEDLPLEFVWLPKVEELKEICSHLEKRQCDDTFKPFGSICKFKLFLSKHCGFPLYVSDCKPRIEFDMSLKSSLDESKAKNDLFYAEFLYVVNCSIKLEKDLNQDYNRFLNFFCSIKNFQFDLWLKPIPSLLSNCKIDTSDETFELSKFSLGNFVSLNTFVEHFDSKTSLEQFGYKVTQNKLQFLHDYRKLILYFVVGKKLSVKKRNATTHRFHKIEIPYGALHCMIISKSETLTIYLRMIQSPLMYGVYQSNDESDSYIEFYDIRPGTPWFREVDFFEGNTQIRKEFSMNTVLKIDFESKSLDYNFLFKLFIHCKNLQIYFAPVTVKENFSQHLKISFPLDDFDCFYALQCLLTYSFEILDQLIVRNEVDELKLFLDQKSKEDAAAVCEALYIIYDAAIQGNVFIFFHCFKDLFQRLHGKSALLLTNELPEGKEVKEKKLSKSLLIKRVIATPTHFRLMPPVPTLKSRALRDCDPKYSLRLSIRDVDLDMINWSLRKGHFPELDKKLMEFFSKYFKTPLLQGIKIGKRNYKYIGNSTSQLKAHGMWFYAKDENNLTADKLRKKFGELEKIKKVPKYMARLGQTFSQSMGNIPVPQDWTNVKDPEKDIEMGVKNYLKMPDDDQDSDEEKKPPEKFLKEVVPDESIEKEISEPGEPYNFSDGIGRISMELAEMIYNEFKLEDYKPCAMQIRYAGCKGMLVVDPKLKGKQIMFRKSMKKFESDHSSLEILKFSEKRTACLNRPFISILEQLGVQKEVFLELQKEMIQNHITSMFDENAACEFLNRNSLLRLNFIKMYLAEISFTEDPLFRSMIYSLFQKQIELLKTKASIEIPVDQGRTFFGVLDETFQLQYGEVFIQYSDWKTNKPVILEGTVLVTKNPCMHPGDVRKFKAVDVEELHHIVDCIVFPANGPRPHPDEMAGSDLDGDEYTAIWLSSLIFSRDNYKPMDFARKDKKEDLIKPVEPKDELDHFGNFIFNDDVGRIANAHLVHADNIKDGIFSEKCLNLAKKYSISLDFAKSGQSIKIGRDRAYKYPDFMEKWNEQLTYLSTKALGHLFRSCKKLELGLDTERNEIDYILDLELQHEHWGKKYKKSAERMLKQYSKKIKMFLRNYGFENEGQLLAGALINPPKHYDNRHDMMNLMALLEYEIQFIFQDFQFKFFAEFGGKPRDGVFTDAMHQKASAWYMVSYSKSKIEDSSYFGLPWTVTDVLVDLKTKNKKGSTMMNPKTILENVVDKSVAKHMPVELTPQTDSEIIYENRFDMLDLAFKVLTKWIKSQREHFSDFNYKEIEKIFGNQFDKLTTKITTCDLKYIEKLKKKNDIKKAISPCFYIIRTILEIAKIGAHPTRCSPAMQELGLLAWITLIKIACTYNPQYLGIPNEAGEYAETVFYKAQDNIIEVITLSLNDKNISYNQEFTKKLLKDEEEVRDYLIKYTKLKEIEFRKYQGRKNENFLRMTVRGTRYSIEKLKDIAVLGDFYELVYRNKPPFNYT